MRLVTVGIALAGLAGCATGTGGVLGGGASGGGSSLSGAITIPSDYQGTPAEFCAALEIRATDVSGVPVGRANAISNTDRCVYEASLPANTALQLTVRNGGVLQCLKGQSVAVNPETVNLQLKPGENRTADFTGDCQS
ncbi:MAG TPA: hypothetical protein VH208_11450 [Myxococcaceae bacterium]|nr:hypothetical protein [Myxococcaceae bacterium]